jgi:hypothetical protein
MNSLPFISHHLFVAAVGNEGRRQERPTRSDRLFAGPAEQATAIPLEVLDGREPMEEVVSRTSRARINEARA